MPTGSRLWSRWLESHDIVTAVHVQNFACNARTCLGGEEYASRSHLGDFDIPLQGGRFPMRLEHVAETGNATRGQGFDRPRRNRVDANLLFAEVKSQITHGAFE